MGRPSISGSLRQEYYWCEWNGWSDTQIEQVSHSCDEQSLSNGDCYFSLNVLPTQKNHNEDGLSPCRSRVIPGECIYCNVEVLNCFRKLTVELSVIEKFIVSVWLILLLCDSLHPCIFESSAYGLSWQVISESRKAFRSVRKRTRNLSTRKTSE